jgi:Na+/melibiose symporter-like transporter
MPGVRWLPWTLPFVCFILVTYIVISRWNCWLLSIWTGWILVLLGISLSTLYTRNSSNAMWVCVAILLGSGIGILYPSLHTASELIASQACDEEMTRRSVTNYGFFHLLGKTFGIAIGSSIFGNELLQDFRSIPTVKEYARNYAKDAVALVARIRATPGGEGSPRMLITDAYVDTLRVMWIVLSAFAALALLISFLGRPRELKPQRDVELRNLDESYVV